MHFKKTVFLLFFLSTSFFGFSQKMNIKGIVFDSSGVKTLNNVSVLSVRIKDSLLLGATRTKFDGVFEFANFPIDTFSLIIEHPEYEAKTYYIIGHKGNLEINIPRIQLNSVTKNLAEVVVFANKNPIFYRGDTLVYVADSFKVGENAVVEDLLKKLPGIKVNEDGTLTSQGKDISQVLVDGDEFFGSDPTIATRNLGAKSISSVQVYEKKNENSKVGEDEKIQVLDLKLKDGAKKGYFGKISGASDFAAFNKDAFYESEMLFNKFNNKQKISLFLLSSNTPKSNFGFRDMNKFGLENERNASGRTMFTQGNPTNTSGFPQTLKAGIYYSDKIGKTGKIGFNYSYSESTLIANSNSSSQYFLADTTYFLKDSIQNTTKNQGHRLNLSYSVNLDSLTFIEVKPNLSIDFANSDENNTTRFLSETNIKSLETIIKNTNDSKGLGSNSQALIRRKFMKKNRELELKYILGFSDNKTAGNLLTTTNKILLNSIDTIDQKKNNDNSSLSNYGILSYTEPLSDNWKLQFEYLFENGQNKQDKKAFNRGDGSYSQSVSSLSNVFDNFRIQHRLTAIGSFEKNYHTVIGGLGIRNIAIENINYISDKVIIQNFNNLLPRLSYQFKPSMSKRMGIYYTTSSSQPSINDLQPVVDNSNPNRTQAGNPDLQPNYVHNLNGNFNTWQALSGRYIWSGFNASITNNAFANSTTYDDFGRTVSKTVNVDGNLFGNVYFGAGIPFLSRKLEIEPNANASYNRYSNFISGAKNITQNTALSGGLDFSVKLDSLEITIGNTYSYTN
ncbi:MAG: TonB-dependent receptor, partial [Flavobacteriales bacterium]|nr:TonB-dependent receptor [Flavobacteriales bacterium]